MPYRARELLAFYEKASARPADESTEPIEIGRYPRVERKVCLVLQRRDDVRTLFCVEDLSRDADGVPYAHDAWLFRAAELPKATRELLPEGFDAGATLVESVNRQMALLVEVFGSREAFASPQRARQGRRGVPVRRGHRLPRVWHRLPRAARAHRRWPPAGARAYLGLTVRALVGGALLGGVEDAVGDAREAGGAVVLDDLGQVLHPRPAQLEVDGP